MSFIAVIPARYASTRLPGKLLLELAGKPVLQHVYERAKQSRAERIIIATDSPEIMAATIKFGAETLLTSETHHSGTDRIAEVVEKFQLLDETLIVNVQGDEPLIAPENINQVAQNLEHHSDASIATLCTAMDNPEDVLNPNMVKVVMDEQGYALYFSRAPIPWDRECFGGLYREGVKVMNRAQLRGSYYCHMGIYAYRAGFLKSYVSMPQSSLEKAEALEQLRALSNGCKIHVGVTHHDKSIGIDTMDDYQRIKKMMARC
ncbi:MAG: 3-deoxy-manno-octulosonate cytidylyltransferase [Gammaproteobacteria bacterium]|nr:3-deoxy-manno-octulosonate cytidylyltransferase [Gammaproteobacteria bacterium]